MLLLSQFSAASKLCNERSEHSMLLRELANADEITIGTSDGFGTIEIPTGEAGVLVEMAKARAEARIAEIDAELACMGIKVDIGHRVPVRTFEDDAVDADEADGSLPVAA